MRSSIPAALSKQLAAVEGDEIESLSAIFKHLADPTRLRILVLLADGSQCVHELCTDLGMSQPAVSHQLRILRGAGIVRGHREGREIRYSVIDEHMLHVLAAGLVHVRHSGKE
jgi:DNA-binding transcriptional ArsR family regulator